MISDEIKQKMHMIELKKGNDDEDNTWEYNFNKDFHSKQEVIEKKAEKWKMISEMGDAIGWRKMRQGPPKDSRHFWAPPTKVLYSKRTLKDFPNLLREH